MGVDRTRREQTDLPRGMDLGSLLASGAIKGIRSRSDRTPTWQDVKIDALNEDGTFETRVPGRTHAFPHVPQTGDDDLSVGQMARQVYPEGSIHMPVLLTRRRAPFGGIGSVGGGPEPPFPFEYRAWPRPGRNDQRQNTQRENTTPPTLVVNRTFGVIGSSSSGLIAWEQADGTHRVWTLGPNREWDVEAGTSLISIANAISDPGTQNIIEPSRQELWTFPPGRWDLNTRNPITNVPATDGGTFAPVPNPDGSNIDINENWVDGAYLCGSARNFIVPSRTLNGASNRWRTGSPKETNFGGSCEWFRHWGLSSSNVIDFLDAFSLPPLDGPGTWLTDDDGVTHTGAFPALFTEWPHGLYDPVSNIYWDQRFYWDVASLTTGLYQLAGLDPSGGFSWRTKYPANRQLSNSNPNTTIPWGLWALDDSGNAYGGYIGGGIRHLASYSSGALRWAHALGPKIGGNDWSILEVLIFPRADRAMFLHRWSGDAAGTYRLAALTLNGSFVAQIVCSSEPTIPAYYGGRNWLYGPRDSVTGRRSSWDMDLNVINIAPSGGLVPSVNSVRSSNNGIIQDRTIVMPESILSMTLSGGNWTLREWI